MNVVKDLSCHVTNYVVNKKLKIENITLGANIHGYMFPKV